MLSHILAEVLGTGLYVGAHHLSSSNPFITSGTLLLAMFFLNPLAGTLGVSLNPLASLMSYLTSEETLYQMVIFITAQITTILGLSFIFKHFSM